MSYTQLPNGLVVPSGGGVGYAVQKSIEHLKIPDDPRDVKCLYAKAGFTPTGPFMGLKVRMALDQSIDEVFDDGVTIRSMVLLQILRQMEDTDGRFRYQGGDEANVMFYFEELPETDDSQARWDRFVRTPIPNRDSPQEAAT